jgi:voltage-gated potassium channel
LTKSPEDGWRNICCLFFMYQLKRKRAQEIVELARPGDRGSKVFDVFIITLIGLNVLAIVLGSVKDIYTDYQAFFNGFEVFSVVIFSIEYLLRMWACVEESSGRYIHPVKGRLRFAFTPMALIDLVAILPFYLGMFVSLDLRFLRALRLVRILKLTRYSSAINLLLNVFKEEAPSFGAALFILVIILVFASTGIFLFEHEMQPETFSSIPAALWWAVATLTTVGYGDVIPITTGGKIFGIGVMIVGIGMVALPAGILASAFSQQLHQRHEDYKELVDDVLEDGEVSLEERVELENMRVDLGLSKEDAQKIFSRVAREELKRQDTCPHCGEVLNIEERNTHKI